MRIKFFSGNLLIVSIFFLNSCHLNDSLDNEYSRAVIENEVVLSIKRWNFRSAW